ncbi:hypothetical protein CCACVL1_14617 [Corchorus capsularis]|uniref:Uncharacterized protein n=1 Tax=Corchorus capsularis TaxID=210143 RepID=A0A1R3I6G8_COCAP|nr:hypothetical protein CCACVL1_14617 [Corchorus capsularis]
MGGHSKRKRNITEEEIAEYISKKAQKRAANKLRSECSNDSTSFGDSNLNPNFVWRKKIERDVSRGIPLDAFSIKAEKKRQRARMGEIEKLKKRREERALQKAKREEERAFLARERARAEFGDREKKEEEDFEFHQSKAIIDPGENRGLLERDNLELKAMKAMGSMEEGDMEFGSGAEVNLGLDQNISTVFILDMNGTNTIGSIMIMKIHLQKWCKAINSISFTQTLRIKERLLNFTSRKT